MKRMDNRQNKNFQIRLKKKKISRKKPPSQKIGFHKKGPSRYPSM